jgi:hypothetical protein
MASRVKVRSFRASDIERRPKGSHDGFETHGQTCPDLRFHERDWFGYRHGSGAEGARVVINGRTEASVSAARSEILGSVPKASIEGFAGDLATPQAAKLL